MKPPRRVPPASIRTRPLGVADPSSGIQRDDRNFHPCWFEISVQFWGGQSSETNSQNPLRKGRSYAGSQCIPQLEQWQWLPTTPDQTQGWTTRGQCPAKEFTLLLRGLVFTHGKNLLQDFLDIFIHLTLYSIQKVHSVDWYDLLMLFLAFSQLVL